MRFNPLDRRYLAIMGWIAAIFLISGCRRAPAEVPEPPPAASAETAESIAAVEAIEDDEFDEVDTADKPVEAGGPGAQTAPSEASEAPLSQLSELSQRAWRGLSGSRDTCAQGFDYFPGGGIYSFYCHLKGFATLQQIETLLGVPVFLRGPHQGGELNRQSKTSFGHYNPVFVQALASWALPAAQDEAFRDATQSTYDHSMKTLARTYWVTYQKLKSHPDYWHAQQGELQQYLADGGVPDAYEDRYFVFMNPEFMAHRDKPIDFFYDRGFDGDYNGNVVKSAVWFWLRRGIDGTAEDFANGLEELLALYDPSMLAPGEPAFDADGFEK